LADSRLESETANAETDAARLDVWLWHAHFFRRREDAGAFVEAGKVRLERHGQIRRVSKRATFVGQGDILTFVTGGKPHRVRITAFAERRSEAASARALYEPLV